MSDDRLSILFCAPDDIISKTVAEQLGAHSAVFLLRESHSLDEAQRLVRLGDFNTVVVDPIGMGIRRAREFIFRTRADIPGINFVLLLDREAPEVRDGSFYHGEAARFHHYYVLDRRTPSALLPDEVGVVLQTCVNDLRRHLQRLVADRAIEQVRVLAVARDDNELSGAAQGLFDAQDLLVHQAGLRQQDATVRPASVFLSYRFAAATIAPGEIEDFRQLLADAGFTVVTGRRVSGFVSSTVLQRIRECEYFVAVFSRDQLIMENVGGESRYSTSAWVVEEKGAAIALSKPIVLLVENGVTDIGGLHGDWQLLRFGPATFMLAANRALQSLMELRDQVSRNRIR